MRPFLLAILLCLIPAIGNAQHALTSGGTYDPAIPTPRSVLGYEIGERFTPHHMIARYAERVAAASPRIALDTVAVTFEGRESLLIIATSEANQARLAEIRGHAQRIADPRGASAADIARSFASDASALACCTKPMMAFRTTIAAIAIAS